MIGYLRGNILESDGNKMIVDVSGVGYLVRTATSHESRATSEIELFIHTHVKEDEISLYGFEDKKALKMFELLISVSGVGPKRALDILSKNSAESVQKAVANAEVGFFTSVSGIGKKNGQKIILELKGKLGSLKELDLGGGEVEDDLTQALMGMGFKRDAIHMVLEKLEPSLNDEEKLRMAIKMLGRK